MPDEERLTWNVSEFLASLAVEPKASPTLRYPYGVLSVFEIHADYFTPTLSYSVEFYPDTVRAIATLYTQHAERLLEGSYDEEDLLDVLDWDRRCERNVRNLIADPDGAQSVTVAEANYEIHVGYPTLSLEVLAEGSWPIVAGDIVSRLMERFKEEEDLEYWEPGEESDADPEDILLLRRANRFVSRVDLDSPGARRVFCSLSSALCERLDCEGG